MPLALTAARMVFFLFTLLSVQAGCAPDDPPPHYTAVITDVYNVQTTVEHFFILYWWEERGETPFLKPESLASKQLIVEVMKPLSDDPVKVRITTEHIPFDQLDSIAFELTDSGKIMTIATRDGRRIQTGAGFPTMLKKDPSAGLADMKMYARGIESKEGKKINFQLPFDYIKQIRITAITAT